jgi:RimJ/RimL family protein N-acetyltransferase
MDSLADSIFNPRSALAGWQGKMSEVKNLQSYPPHRIETQRTVIRCYTTSDAPLMISTLSKNVDHLRPWMDWAAHEPESLDAKRNRLQQNLDDFNSGTDFTYGIFDKQESELIGGTGLHPRIGPSAFEIGYWVSIARINQGLATEVSAALTRVAFELTGVNQVQIRCDPKNARSSRVPEKLGFLHSSTIPADTTDVHGQPRDTLVWSMTAEAYRASGLPSAKIAAFDEAGNSVPFESSP